MTSVPILTEPTFVDVGVAVPGASSSTATIKLLPAEANLFRACVAAVAAAGTGTVVRVAGGWVRDKLLGKDNHDIDIALDNVTGRQFADTLNNFLRESGFRTSTVAVIQANPEQSKHLETATTRVFDMWIDFVNLRAEVYDPGSRIPRMTFGTAVQVRPAATFLALAVF